jgi:hypothetical protein
MFDPSVELKINNKRVAAIWRAKDTGEDTCGIRLGHLYMDTPVRPFRFTDRLFFVCWGGKNPWRFWLRPFHFSLKFESSKWIYRNRAPWGRKFIKYVEE